jgi:hypothetical protein
MFYLFPFDNVMTVEFRKYNPDASGSPERHQWKLRNYLWSVAGPKFAHDVEENIADPDIRYKMVDGFSAIWRFKLENIVTGKNTIAADQIIRYPEVSNDSRYTFSLFAFPEEVYGKVLPAYCKFSRDYYRDKGYRTNVLSVGYRISKDQNSLLSYSYDGDILTVDPVSTANPGWYEFLDAYNVFCIERGGIPLLNQTDRLAPAQARKALGEKLAEMGKARKQFDPDDRLLNDYFRGMFAPAETTAAA